MAEGPAKAAGALRTIGELSAETGIAQHILRYWETRFPSLRPLQRAGNRRYYRPEDVTLVRQIDALLNREGYTIKGVQGVLKRGGPVDAARPEDQAPAIEGPMVEASASAGLAGAPSVGAGIDVDALGPIRALLIRALAEDA